MTDNGIQHSKLKGVSKTPELEAALEGIRSVTIERPVLHAAVTTALRKLIVEGTLPPGTRLNERDLCASLGVSRTPLREALKALAAEGLIEHQPNRGAVVPVLGESDIIDAFELLGCLEGFAGELACARITPEQLADVKALHFSMLACYARVDLPGYYSLNQQIHDRINDIAGNGSLRQTYQSVNRRLQALRFRSNHDPKKWQRAVADHEKMIAALEARDGALMSAILRAHLDEKKEAVLAAMRTVAAA